MQVKQISYETLYYMKGDMEDQFKIELIFNSIKICKFLQNIFFFRFFFVYFSPKLFTLEEIQSGSYICLKKNKSIFE